VTAPTSTSTGQPVWDSLADIPTDVTRVTDRDGTTWTRHPQYDDQWASLHPVDGEPMGYWGETLDSPLDGTDEFGPFSLAPRPMLIALRAIADAGLPEPTGLAVYRNTEFAVARLDTLDAFITYAEALRPAEITAHRGPRGTNYTFTTSRFDVAHIGDHDPGPPAIRAVDLDDLRQLAADIEHAQDHSAPADRADLEG
jgi:hypothetical protein